jgi:hypothetical protein
LVLVKSGAATYSSRAIENLGSRSTRVSAISASPQAINPYDFLAIDHLLSDEERDTALVVGGALSGIQAFR